jgi:hypothetical protein
MTKKFLDALVEFVNVAADEFDHLEDGDTTKVMLNTEDNVKAMHDKYDDDYFGPCCMDYYDKSHELVYYSVHDGIMSSSAEDILDWVKEEIQNDRK